MAAAPSAPALRQPPGYLGEEVFWRRTAINAAPSETRSENEWAASATRTRLPQAAPTIALEAERATLTPAPMTVMRASSDSRVLVGGALASMLGTRALCTSRTGGAIAGDALWMWTCACAVAVDIKSALSARAVPILAAER